MTATILIRVAKESTPARNTGVRYGLLSPDHYFRFSPRKLVAYILLVMGFVVILTALIGCVFIYCYPGIYFPDMISGKGTSFHAVAYNTNEVNVDKSKNISESPFNNYRIVCYYVIPSNETHSRQLPPNYVDPYLCTHIIVGFASVTNGSLSPVSSHILNVYKTIVNFKKMNPSMKVLLSIADMSSNGEFGKMVADENLRFKFSSNIVGFIQTMNFDGIDLDWEFPAWPVADESQKNNFTILLQNIRKEIMNAHNNESFLLSVAVGAPEAIVDQSYHIPGIARYVDFINLMSYDYHMYTQYLPLTGPNSPLFPLTKEVGFLQTMNVNWSATHWYHGGMPLEKINVGIPTYGHSFRLVNEDNNGWNAPAKGFGNVGAGGFTSYPDACFFISNPEAVKVFDENYLVPYTYMGNDWISYENELSVGYKARYIKENKFGGAMIFSLNSDDYYGECGSIKFPLLRQITNVLS